MSEMSQPPSGEAEVIEFPLQVDRFEDLRWECQDHHQNVVVRDVSVLAGGEPSSRGTLVPFRGRPALVRDILPEIKEAGLGKAKDSVRRGLTGSLRALWVFLDRLEGGAESSCDSVTELVALPDLSTYNSLADLPLDIFRFFGLHLRDTVSDASARDRYHRCFGILTEASKRHGLESFRWGQQRRRYGPPKHPNP